VKRTGTNRRTVLQQFGYLHEIKTPVSLVKGLSLLAKDFSKSQASGFASLTRKNCPILYEK
jgi:hypothetical protein